jgi:hypothetical protein
VQKALGFWIVLGLALAFRLSWVSIFRSGCIDLHVYYRAVQLWLSGISPYEYKGIEGVLVFKYPPWTLPLFAPLALFEFETWHWLWTFLQLASILYCIRWVIRTGVDLNVACLSAALFWWIWLGHAQAGQFTLFVLVVALWTVPPENEKSLRPTRLSILSLIISLKVFNLFSLLGLTRDLLRPKALSRIVLGFLALNTIFFGVLHLHGNSIGGVALYSEWMHAASSGGSMFAAETIRGQGNHGFTAAILRLLQVPADDSSKDVAVALALGCLLSGAWYFCSRHLSRAERWSGWLAVGVVIHPLLWHHSFVLVYPLCALALDRSVRAKKPLLIATAFIGIALIGLLIPNIVTPVIVRPLELMGSKSWGVMLACVALVLARSPGPRHSEERPKI